MAKKKADANGAAVAEAPPASPTTQATALPRPEPPPHEPEPDKPQDVAREGPPEANGARNDGKKRPVVSYKLSSDRTTVIEVAVWENVVTYNDGNAGVQYSITVNRSYRTDAGWQKGG